MKNICVICMRGGSTGVKNKNLLKFGKKYLMEFTFNQAKKSKLFNKIVLTSDSKKILNVAKKYNLDFYIQRSKKLSNNTISKIPAIIDATKRTEQYFNLKFDYVFDLDVTSPLRNVLDINLAFQKLKNEKKKNLITASPSRRNPYFNMVEFKKRGLSLSKSGKNITCRQKAPKVFDMNASIYIWKKKYLFKRPKTVSKNTSLYIMPEERSLDLDTEFDLKIMKKLISNEKK